MALYGGAINAENCIAGAPDFVYDNPAATAPGEYNYHLRWQSDLRHAGETGYENVSGSDADIGVYGGEGADPFYIAIITTNEGTLDITDDEGYFRLIGPAVVSGNDFTISNTQATGYPPQLIIKAEEYASLSVSTRLNLIGQELEGGAPSILFCGLDPSDTWYGISYETDSECGDLSYVGVEDATTGITFNHIAVIGDGPYDNLFISNCATTGIKFSNAEEIRLYGVYFTECDNIAMEINSSIDFLLTDVNIEDCDNIGIVVVNSTIIIYTPGFTIYISQK